MQSVALVLAGDRGVTVQLAELILGLLAESVTVIVPLAALELGVVTARYSPSVAEFPFPSFSKTISRA